MVSGIYPHKSMQCFQRYLLLYTLPIQKQHPGSEKFLKSCRATHSRSNISVVPIIINRTEPDSEF